MWTSYSRHQVSKTTTLLHTLCNLLQEIVHVLQTGCLHTVRFKPDPLNQNASKQQITVPVRIQLVQGRIKKKVDTNIRTTIIDLQGTSVCNCLRMYTDIKLQCILHLCFERKQATRMGKLIHINTFYLQISVLLLNHVA